MKPWNQLDLNELAALIAKIEAESKGASKAQRAANKETLFILRGIREEKAASALKSIGNAKRKLAR